MMTQDSSFTAVPQPIDFYRGVSMTRPTHCGDDGQYDSFRKNLLILPPEDGYLATATKKSLSDDSSVIDKHLGSWRPFIQFDNSHIITRMTGDPEAPKGYSNATLEVARVDEDVTLVGGTQACVGKVKLLCHNGRCGKVSYDNGYVSQDARVAVCGQLGFPESDEKSKLYCSYSLQRAPYGQVTGPIWLDSVNCNANVHRKLTDCSANPIGVHSCAHSEESVYENHSASSTIVLVDFDESVVTENVPERHPATSQQLCPLEGLLDQLRHDTGMTATEKTIKMVLCLLLANPSPYPEIYSRCHESRD